jgi:hypothetical protein
MPDDSDKKDLILSIFFKHVSYLNFINFINFTFKNLLHFHLNHHFFLLGSVL